MTRVYYDRNVKRIEEGMTLRHNDGSTAEVCKCMCMGVETLGFRSARVNHIHGQVGLSFPEESAFMSLADFDLKEWRVVDAKNK